MVGLPADKERMPLILKHNDYHSKLAEMLDCDTYRWLTRDSTKSEEDWPSCTFST